jgi:hypothetical protein
MSTSTTASVARCGASHSRQSRPSRGRVSPLRSGRRAIIVGVATGLYPALIKAAFDAFDRKDMSALAYAVGQHRLPEQGETARGGNRDDDERAVGEGAHVLVTRVEADMQAALYAHLIDADLAQLGRESPAAFTQRFTGHRAQPACRPRRG